ncbi:MAG: TolC family protein, partial [Sphingopyxis sp.]
DPMILIAKLSPAILLVGLAGCAAVGPDYVPPRIEAPGAYAAQPAGIGGASAEAAWWRQFGDPALDALIAEALAANLDARLAVARLDEARALAGVSRAARLPGGGVAAGYQRRREADVERAGGQPREGDALRAGAEASWEIDLFGRVRRGVEAAEAEVGGAEAALRSVRAAVTADVASHYFELRGSEAAFAIAHRQIET